MILLGAVLEEVSGSRLDDLLTMRVFRPLELRDTRFNPLTAHGEYGGFTLAQADATRLPLGDGTFDAVFSTATFHWVHDHAALFAENEPFALFERWFKEAKEKEPNDPNAMALATVDADGRVVDSLGWHTQGTIDAVLPGARQPTLLLSIRFYLTRIAARAGIAASKKR